MASDGSDRLAAACAAVDQACVALLDPTPEKFDRCSHLLSAAISELKAEREFGSAAERRQLLARDARDLQQSIGRARLLLESAAAFHRNWVQWLGALCAGYTGEGEPAPLDAGWRLFARG